MYGHTYSKSMDQPGKAANPARGQLNRKNEFYNQRNIGGNTRDVSTTQDTGHI